MAENYDNKLLLMWFCSPRAKFYMETWKWKAFLTKEYNVPQEQNFTWKLENERLS